MKKIFIYLNLETTMAIHILLLFILVYFSSPVLADTGLFFYNPEANIDNYIALKNKLTSYLNRNGHYFFEPFTKFDALTDKINKNKSGTFLISSWHYQLLKRTQPIQPMLVAHIQGKTTHHKLLTVKTNISNPEQLKGKRIASSAKEEFARDLLRDMLPGEPKKAIVDSLKILPVPKDLDALMSLTFGMADAALTAEESLKSLATINPTQYGSLKILVTSSDFPLPMVTILNDAGIAPTKDQEQLFSLLIAMEKSPEGLALLKTIGIDGFRKFEKDLGGR